MKNIYVVGTAVAIAACSTHPIRCRGALQPINEPAAPARAAGTTGPAAPSRPAVPGKSAANAMAPAHSKSAAPASNSPAAPREPHL